jgi:1-acyl-sn-glycerol-3-phosphate acyltransferase
MKDLVYRLAQLIFRILYKLIFRVEIVGSIPKTGAYIIASNHFSNLDPPLIGCFVGRPDVYYMAKDGMFKNRYWGALFKYLKMIPVRRGSNDKDALIHVLKILDEGHSLLMFPEGTRRKNGEIHPKKGIGFLSVNSGKKIIPVKLENTDKFYKFKKIKMIIGEPIDIDITKSYLDISKEVLTIIEAM